MEEMVIHVELASESKSASVYFPALDTVSLATLLKFNMLNVKEGTVS
jgi:hypothetical protein